MKLTFPYCLCPQWGERDCVGRRAGRSPAKGCSPGQVDLRSYRGGPGSGARHALGAAVRAGTTEQPRGRGAAAPPQRAARGPLLRERNTNNQGKADTEMACTANESCRAKNLSAMEGPLLQAEIPKF